MRELTMLNWVAPSEAYVIEHDVRRGKPFNYATLGPEDVAPGTSMRDFMDIVGCHDFNSNMNALYWGIRASYPPVFDRAADYATFVAQHAAVLDVREAGKMQDSELKEEVISDILARLSQDEQARYEEQSLLADIPPFSLFEAIAPYLRSFPVEMLTVSVELGCSKSSLRKSRIAAIPLFATASLLFVYVVFTANLLARWTLSTIGLFALGLAAFCVVGVGDEDSILGITFPEGVTIGDFADRVVASVNGARGHGGHGVNSGHRTN